MTQSGNPWIGITQTWKQISSLFPSREDSEQEAMLYYRRACLAAAEERYDVAMVFCDKALRLDSRHLPARLLIAQIHHRGHGDLDAAVEGYQKVVSLSGYDSDNPYCAAARMALDAIVSQAEESRLASSSLIPATQT